MELFYVLAVLAALLIIYFAFFKKSAPPELEPGREEKKQRLEPKPVSRRAPAPEALEPEAEPGDEGETIPISEEREPARRSIAPVRDVDSLRRGLARSRQEGGFFDRLRSLLTGKKELSSELTEQIEEVLLSSDVGVQTTQKILERIKETLSGSDLVDADKVWEALRAEARRILALDGRSGAFELHAKPTVVLMVGVNGAGKTTTIGKLATKLMANDNRSMLAAADTFRAAAVQQLVVWGERVGCEVVRGKDGADPGSVIFDAVKKAQEAGAEVVLADTAGRLHTKTNLMTELKKIVKTTNKAMEGAPHEVLLVIDATNGQNALAQATEFNEALPLTGVILTKLDGTAKGGMILGICDTLKLPVRFIGLGERSDDLHEFSAEQFVEALLGKEESEAGAA